jgi:hypothetical protein
MSKIVRSRFLDQFGLEYQISNVTRFVLGFFLVLFASPFANGQGLVEIDPLFRVRTLCSEVRRHLVVGGSRLLYDRIPTSRLTFDGRYAVICHPAISICLYQTADLTESWIKQEPRCVAAWSDTQREGVFVLLGDQEFDPGKVSRIEPSYETWYFSSLESLQKWEPKWKYASGKHRDSNFQWLESVKLWAVYYHKSNTAFNLHVVQMMDDNGLIVGTFEIPGRIIGMELGKSDALEIYYATSDKGDIEWRVRVGMVHADKQRLASNRELYRMRVPGLAKTVGWSWGSSIFDTRRFRFRGLKSGDVRKFALESLASPNFFTHQDAGATLPNQAVFPSVAIGRTFNLGISQSDESESGFELVRGQYEPNDYHRHLPRSKLLNRNGASVVFPLLFTESLVDVVLDGNQGTALSVHCTLTPDGLADYRIWNFDLPTAVDYSDGSSGSENP